MMTRLSKAHPSQMSRLVGTSRVPEGMLELAARPSHYAHFCALSRYGVTTDWSYLALILRWHPGCRSLEILRVPESLLC